MAFTKINKNTAHQNIQWQGLFKHMKRDYARLARLQPTLRLCCFHLRYNHMGSKKKKASQKTFTEGATVPKPHALSLVVV